LETIKNEIAAMLREPGTEHSYTEKTRDVHALRGVLSREPLKVVRLLLSFNITPDSQEASTSSHAKTLLVEQRSRKPTFVT
jgi:hypothetical protein